MTFNHINANGQVVGKFTADEIRNEGMLVKVISYSPKGSESLTGLIYLAPGQIISLETT